MKTTLSDIISCTLLYYFCMYNSYTCTRLYELFCMYIILYKFYTISIYYIIHTLIEEIIISNGDILNQQS